jgi:hypothetical protein
MWQRRVRACFGLGHARVTRKTLAEWARECGDGNGLNGSLNGSHHRYSVLFLSFLFLFSENH